MPPTRSEPSGRGKGSFYRPNSSSGRFFSKRAERITADREKKARRDALRSHPATPAQQPLSSHEDNVSSVNDDSSLSQDDPLVLEDDLFVLEDDSPPLEDDSLILSTISTPSISSIAATTPSTVSTPQCDDTCQISGSCSYEPWPEAHQPAVHNEVPRQISLSELLGTDSLKFDTSECPLESPELQIDYILSIKFEYIQRRVLTYLEEAKYREEVKSHHVFALAGKNIHVNISWTCPCCGRRHICSIKHVLKWFHALAYWKRGSKSIVFNLLLSPLGTSHLCAPRDDYICLNPACVCFESNSKNNQRKVCHRGGKDCGHSPPCHENPGRDKLYNSIGEHCGWIDSRPQPPAPKMRPPPPIMHPAPPIMHPPPPIMHPAPPIMHPAPPTNPSSWIDKVPLLPPPDRRIPQKCDECRATGKPCNKSIYVPICTNWFLAALGEEWVHKQEHCSRDWVLSFGSIRRIRSSSGGSGNVVTGVW